MSQVHEFLRSEEQLPPSRNRHSRVRLVVLVVGLAVLGALVVGAIVGVRSLMAAQDFEGEGSGDVTVTVAKGDSLREIGQKLAEAGVVANADAFVAAAEAEERSASIGPGTYQLRLGMSGAAAVALMLDPASRAASRLVLPEGLRLEQTVAAAAKATRLPEEDFRAALRNPGDLGLPKWAKGRPEGFLFPATYDLAPDQSATDVLAMTVARFDQAAEEVDLVARAKEAGLKPYDVLIVASLVQAESAPNDFTKVARVIYNRLAQGLPLQLDSTVNYALGIRELQLSDEQLAVDSPYNTYINTGLPPGPINSPGEAAIEAALAPARGDWLYFVTVDPQTLETKFTSDYDEFLRFKAELREALARESASAAATATAAPGP